MGRPITLKEYERIADAQKTLCNLCNQKARTRDCARCTVTRLFEEAKDKAEKRGLINEKERSSATRLEDGSVLIFLKDCVIGQYHISMTETDHPYKDVEYNIHVTTVYGDKEGYPYAISVAGKTKGGYVTNSKTCADRHYHTLCKMAKEAISA